MNCLFRDESLLSSTRLVVVKNMIINELQICRWSQVQILLYLLLALIFTISLHSSCASYSLRKCCLLYLTQLFLSFVLLLRLSLVSWELLPLSSLQVSSMDSALSILDLGSAYGTAKAGVGVCSMGVFRPDVVMKNMLPVIMAGILGIYGLIASIIMVYASNVSFLL